MFMAFAPSMARFKVSKGFGNGGCWGMKLHDYCDIIKNPMDLGTVKSKLGKNLYDLPMGFAVDVRLTFNNAMRYHPKGLNVYNLVDQFLSRFEEWYRPIRDKIVLSQRDLYDALSAIDLMKPQRSTLKDKLWPYDSSLSLDQMKQDLETLNWQECPVQSIETISQLESSGGSDVVSKSLPMSSFEISGKRRRSKRMRNIADNGTAARCNIPRPDVVGTYGVGAGATKHDSSLFVDKYSWDF
ncbi:hypothetical protein GH714_025502 [Hevea brasiliensis]|uniref:Bromo domain-containing protein n=1 Tax=Hevea brasiliensis TaxID=3981 RepID=A0A6A6KJC3_HEVBR|nr:hypothetical protein GH714_025502 [Hevea brasiliensis]